MAHAQPEQPQEESMEEEAEAAQDQTVPSLRESEVPRPQQAVIQGQAQEQRRALPRGGRPPLPPRPRPPSPSSHLDPPRPARPSQSSQMQYAIGALLSNVIAENAVTRLASEAQGLGQRSGLAALLPQPTPASAIHDNTADLGLQKYARTLNDSEKAILRQYHSRVIEAHQVGNVLTQHVGAPVEIVWSFCRNFYHPLPYKLHLSGCHRVSGDGGVGSTRICEVREGIAAKFSVERCEILDEEKHVAGFQVVGGDHRCPNYRSVTSLHERVGKDGQRKTLLIESYTCDIQRGNTAVEVEIFCEGFVKELLTRLDEVSTEKYRLESGGS